MFLSMIFADFMGPLLFVTPAEFSSDELSQPTKVSIAMEVEPRCVHLANLEMKNASYTNESIAGHLSCWNVFMKCLFYVRNDFLVWSF